MSKTRPQAPALPRSDVGDSIPYVTGATIRSIPNRKKPLPPDANGSKLPHFRLLQLQSHVAFRCTRCRRDGVRDDSVAVHDSNATLMCARCYSREVKPRLYKPTRLVPFGSLLDWLNSEPDPVKTAVPQDVGSRGAEAAVPTGARVASLLIAPTSVADLARNPMIPDEHAVANEGVRLQIKNATSALGPRGSEKHPCLRVFGTCAHGALCFFRDAPVNLSLSFLMGLRDTSPSEECSAVFDLPSGRAPPRTDTGFEKWVAERRNSQNRAEWQLWNQPGSRALLDAIMPMPKQEPKAPAKVQLSIDALKKTLSKV